MEIIYHSSPHVNKAIEWMKEKCPRYRNDKVSSTDGKCKNRDIRLAFYDLETGGFRKDADLLQVCFHCDGVDDLDLYIMPEKGIDRLLSFLERNHELHELSKSFPETLFFGDSLPTVRKLKSKLDLPSCKLSDVYRKFFAEDFAAHDAVADVTALRRIIFHSSSATTL